VSGWALLGLVAAVSPVLAAGAGRLSGRHDLDAGVSGLGLVGAIVAAIAVAADGPVTAFDGWVVFDRVGLAWTVFALAVVWSIRSFAHRQLAADPLRHRFEMWSAVTATSGVALFIAGNLAALAIAAVVSGLAVAGVVGAHLRGGPVRRRVSTVLAVGDVALVVGLVAVMVDAGTIDASAMVLVDGPVLHLGATAVVIAALVACAQVPAHRWLLSTLAAPTPASALLHAGLVNAGGVILIRTAPLVGRSTIAVVVGLAVTVLSMTVAVAVMRMRSEVKSALVWSTVAQMGFMLTQALVGLGAAAAAHLIAHGAYKSHLFLASGSTIEHPPLQSRPTSPADRLLALVSGVGVVAVAALLSGYDITAQDGAAVLIPLFAAATIVVVLAGPRGIDATQPARSAVLVGAMGLLSFVYLAALWRFEKWLQLPEATPSGALAMVVIVSVLVLAGAWVSGRLSHDPRPAAAAAEARLVALSRPPEAGAGHVGATTGAA
jgi:NADH:ubiquinone oxidoreductase subunit 5 (subunit L)/multisubunit Na+/H+ antiporter MnhA subunit